MLPTRANVHNTASAQWIEDKIYIANHKLSGLLCRTAKYRGIYRHYLDCGSLRTTNLSTLKAKRTQRPKDTARRTRTLCGSKRVLANPCPAAFNDLTLKRGTYTLRIYDPVFTKRALKLPRDCFGDSQVVEGKQEPNGQALAAKARLIALERCSSGDEFEDKAGDKPPSDAYSEDQPAGSQYETIVAGLNIRGRFRRLRYTRANYSSPNDHASVSWPRLCPSHSTVTPRSSALSTYHARWYISRAWLRVKMCFA